MDFILDLDNNINKFGNPIYNKTWNEFVSNIMFHGNTYELNNKEKELYEFIFNIKIKSSKTIDVYYEIYNNLLIRYSHIKYNETGSKTQDNLFLCIPNGNFSKLTLQSQLRKIEFEKMNDIPKEYIKNVEKIITELHKNTYDIIDDLDEKLNKITHIFSDITDLFDNIRIFYNSQENKNELLIKPQIVNEHKNIKKYFWYFFYK
jgi:hypothetical protein